MPYLPESMLIHKKALKPGKKTYSSRARMAIRPEDTIRVPEDRNNAYGAIMDTLVNVNPHKAHETELPYKKLFFQKIEHICLKDGYDINAAQMFCENEEKSFSTQGLLLRVDFSGASDPSEIMGASVGNNESTTPYGFVFNFIGGENQKSRSENKIIAPVYLIDDRLLNTLEHKGIPQEKIDSVGENLMLLAGCSDHDHIHGMTLEYSEELPYYIESESHNKFYGSALEKHALAVHAKVFKELFKERPKRKEHFLSYVSKSLTDILAIQKHLAASASNEQDIKNNNDIVTYLTEIHAHRIFRVLSPDDPDLDISTNDTPSINDTLDALNIHVPPQKLDADSNYSDALSNKEKLLLNLSTTDSNAPALRPGMYRDLHDIDAIDVQYCAHEYRPVKHTLTEIMDDFSLSSKGVSSNDAYFKKFPLPTT